MPGKTRSKSQKPRDAQSITRANVQATRKLEASTLAKRTLADRISDAIARFCGSMVFVVLHAIFFTVWIVLNSIEATTFDPYPFTFLTLVVSLEAIFLSSFILISQNYEMRITSQRNQLDLQINLLAEQENTKMLRMLEQIAKHVGAQCDDDPEIRALEQATSPETLLKQIEAANLGEHG